MVSPTPDAFPGLDLGPLKRHLEAAYPAEGCAVIYRTPEGGFELVLMTNAADRYHALDPVRFPRTARTAYLFEPKEWLRIEREAEDRGRVLHGIVHSHADVGAYFSEEDQNQAAPEGMPLYPGILYLVVAVDKGVASSSRIYVWEEGVWKERAAPDFSRVVNGHSSPL